MIQATRDRRRHPRPRCPASRTARSAPSTASPSRCARGEVFGLLGPNGAGKTTTVEMLEGLRKPDAGQLEILGIDAVSQPDALKERIGVTLQTAELYPKLTVIEVLDLFRSFYSRSLPTSRARRLPRPRREEQGPDEGAVGRPAPAPRRGARPRQRPGGRLPRRADDRARPGRPAIAVGPRRPAARTRARRSS